MSVTDHIRASICMATYNGETFILTQLQSILPQLAGNDELIISDDGSTDGTKEIILALNDPRIRFVRNESGKKGPVGNFENALRLARGKIVFFADQDDIWLPDKLAQHLLHHEQYDLVISNAIVTDRNKNVLFDSFFAERNSGKGLMRNLVKNSYIGCCMSFNRKIAEAALPFPKDIHMHDWWIGLVAEVTGSVYFLQKPMMYYIRHDNNASGTLTETLPLKLQFINRYQLLKNILFFLIYKHGKH
jgi:glycosyltransferase involved in cell wall biosynthesis